ncbi:MAG TPA: SGNH/GDSL hydrolase family protein [Myxococcales bacterium]|nr:SGNH/GDSL hydrolase family protein [Myxococcales bacterium]
MAGRFEAVLLLGIGVGCSGGRAADVIRPDGGILLAVDAGPADALGDGGADGGAVDGGPPAAPEVFLPAFHQALRWSELAPDPTTYRMRIPPGRAGDRVEVTFRSGDGPLAIAAATVATAGADGALAGVPVPLTFAGQPGFTAGARALVTSDAAPLAVQFHQDVYVSFEAQGNLAVSAVALFPESYCEAGSHSLDASLAGQVPHPQAIGVATIEVEGAPSRVGIALGDSITEGYVQSCVPWTPACGVPPDDYRNCWTYVAEGLLGWPVLNAAVSGQDAETGLANLGQEVLAVPGLTDSMTLLGTNDLGGSDTPQDIENVLAQIYQALAPVSRVWGVTLPPKDPADPDLAVIQAELTAVDGWLRGGTAPVAGLLDFESVLWASPTDPVDYAPGLGEDGIHPTVEGQRLLGEYTALKLAGAN